jgi:hypothetical protein
MDNHELENLRREFLALKRAQITLEKSLREDKEQKSKQELETCLQELAKYKEVLNQNKTSLDEKSKSCEPCEEAIGSLNDEIAALKKLIADTKREETNLENRDKQNDRCPDEAIFNEIKSALQEKCKRLYKEELEKLKKPHKEDDSGAKDDDKEGANYQAAILALLNKLLEKKQKEVEDKHEEDKGGNKGSDDNDGKDKPNLEGGEGSGDGEDSCLKHLEEFKKAVKAIDTSNDTVNIKLQNLKTLFTKFEKETEVPPPDQNSLAYF